MTKNHLLQLVEVAIRNIQEGMHEDTVRRLVDAVGVYPRGGRIWVDTSEWLKLRNVGRKAVKRVLASLAAVGVKVGGRKGL